MYKKILVPLDGSELAECVLPHVQSIAKGCGVQSVVFIRAVEPFHVPSGGEGGGFRDEDIKRINSDNKADAERYLSQVSSEAKYDGVKVRWEVISGKPAESIAEYATKNAVDLIIIATHGRSGVSRWVWGSVADRLLHSARAAVLMVRAPGCVPGI